MNRLILIGNGFDLAHKLETSYCHFIKDYLAKSINDFFSNALHDDPLLQIRMKYNGYTPSSYKKIGPAEALQTLNNISNDTYCEVNIKSSFLLDTIHKLNTVNWVDLENDYFEKLIHCKSTRGYDFDKVKMLNEEFNFLKGALEKYLIKHQSENPIEISEKLLKRFYESIKGKDIVTISMRDRIPKRVLFLSFNYTSTLEKYIEKRNNDIPTKINYIHGQLQSNNNPIIFGFGDEYNKSYLEFEEINNKQLLQHIKSFGYFKTSNYHDLIRFLESDVFQVCIYGHSLGLSDRTMLKQIFEHENCKSIKIFYHKTGDDQNDFTDKTYDISSHFTDKALMRKKIVPFDKSFPMPQPGFDA